MKEAWTWREGFRFALASKLAPKGATSYAMNRAEKWGSLYLTPLHKTIGWISSNIRWPMFIALTTFVTGLIALLVFYNIPAIYILGRLIPFQSIRFLLFLYIETCLLSLSSCALGRFQNKSLIELWKKGLLTPVFPGDDDKNFLP